MTSLKENSKKLSERWIWISIVLFWMLMFFHALLMWPAEFRSNMMGRLNEHNRIMFENYKEVEDIKLWIKTMEHYTILPSHCDIPICGGKINSLPCFKPGVGPNGNWSCWD